MNEPSETRTLQGADAVEALLEKAAPRPMPPAHIEQEVREAVRSEWQAVARGTRTRRQTFRFAMAATILLAVAATFTVLRTTGIAPIEVAAIARSHGSIVLEGERSGQLPAETFAAIVTGQMLLTAADSAAALHWHRGGSLRVDENSRIEFVSASEIFLHSGRVYFDTAYAPSDMSFVIRTTHGSVSHVGTQYMTESKSASLIVSVREGTVMVEGTFHDQVAYEGQVVELVGRAPVTVTNTTGVGSDWEWIESVAPAVDMRGKSTYDFLLWVGRETGRDVKFASAAAEQLARSTEFIGDIKGNPRSDLRLWMMTTDLEARFDADGPSIIVSLAR